MFNVISRFIDSLSSNTTFQDTINIIFSFSRMHSTRAINQINSFSQCNVLPNLGFSRNWCSSTDFLFFKWINDTWFSDIWITDKTYTDVFFISVENIELSEQVNKWTLTEWVWNRCLVGNGWILLWQILNPFLQNPNWDQVSFVD